MKLSKFAEMTTNLNGDAELLTFDPESGNNQPVTGFTYGDKEVILYTDCDECGDESETCALHQKYPSAQAAPVEREATPCNYCHTGESGDHEICAEVAEKERQRKGFGVAAPSTEMDCRNCLDFNHTHDQFCVRFGKHGRREVAHSTEEKGQTPTHGGPPMTLREIMDAAIDKAVLAILQRNGGK